MSQWHADLDRADLGRGAELTVLSDHQLVRVITSDTLSIEKPDGQRFSALVLERTEGKIRLVLQDGRVVSLRLAVDESLTGSWVPGMQFSHQIWVAN